MDDDAIVAIVKPLLMPDSSDFMRALEFREKTLKLTKGQRAIAAINLLPQVKQVIKEHGLSTVRPGKRSSKPGPPLPDRVRPRQIAAEICGCSEKSVSSMMSLRKRWPDLFELVQVGKISINQAVEQSKREGI